MLFFAVIVVVCDVGLYGASCNETCMCGDRARKCDSVDGCVDCAQGWEGEQCATDKDECQNPDACGPDANVSGCNHC